MVASFFIPLFLMFFVPLVDSKTINYKHLIS